MRVTNAWFTLSVTNISQAIYSLRFAILDISII